MQELLNYIVTNLVHHPDQVKIQEVREPGVINYILTVAPEDMGLVIGKNGQVIKSIRKLLIIRAMAEKIKVNLTVQEPTTTG